MRALVAQRVAEGRTDDEIRAEFVRSYGDWILLSPPLLSPNGLVWLAPLLAIALGAWLAWRRLLSPNSFRRWRGLQPRLRYGEIKDCC